MDNTFILQSLKETFRKYQDIFYQITRQVLKERISKNPVFLAAKEPIQKGIPLLYPPHSSWYIHATLLETLVQQQFIRRENVEDFRKAHEHPLKKAAFIIIEPPLVLFIPYERSL